MKLHPDDPLITSYVLGELDPAEAKAVALAIAADQALQQRVALITGTQVALTEIFRTPRGSLLPNQRERIRRNVRKSQWGGHRAVSKFLGARHARVWAAVGAGALLVAGVLMMLGRSAGPNVARVAALQSRGVELVASSVPEVVAEVVSVPSLPAPQRTGYLSAKEFPVLELPLAASGPSLAAITDSVMNLGKRPARETVRLEEVLNHFSLRFSGVTAIARGGSNDWHPDDRSAEVPVDHHAATLSTEMIACPWKPSATLLLISLRGGPQSDAEVQLAFHANPQNVLSYRLLGFDPCEGRTPGTLPTKLVASGVSHLALEIEPFRPASELGALEWSVNGQVAPPVSLVHRKDADPSDDARFAALVCAYARWLSGEESEIIDNEILVGLAREVRSDTLEGEHADFLRLVERSLQL